MSLIELDIGWVETPGERRYLHWELLACEEIVGVFATDRDEVLAVLFDGSPARFHDWALSLTESSYSKGALR